MINEKFRKRFSIGHPNDNDSGDITFYDQFCRSSQDFKDEIDDIYFGAAFKYDHNGQKKMYGDCMGKATCDQSVRNLLKIQDNYGIAASLTLNPTYHPPELLLDKNIRNDFINFIKKYYDAGVRICTISNVHFMRSGVLHEKFPEMKWKNTVNHMVKTAQEVVDYSYLGYDVIQLDRSLSRNVNELKRIKKAAKDRNVKTSLLVREGCIPHCPFKIEHDQIQTAFSGGTLYFQTVGKLTCSRGLVLDQAEGKEMKYDNEIMPRLSPDLIATTKETLDQYLDLVDILKISGRLENLKSVEPKNLGFCWINGHAHGASDSFSRVYDNNLFPFHFWGLGRLFQQDINTPIPLLPKVQNLYGSAEMLELNKTVLNCRLQCYDCHKCEDVYGIQHFDSIIEAKR